MRVVVTGVGLVSDLGIGWSANRDALLEGRSGIGPITRFPTAGFEVRIAGEVRGFDLEALGLSKKDARRMELFTLYSLAAADEALIQAGLCQKDLEKYETEAGVYMGVGIGGLGTIEENKRTEIEKGPRRVSAFLIPKVIPNIVGGTLAIRYGVHGPNLTISTACAASAHSIGEAFLAIRSGRLRIALAGGAEAVITPLAIAGFGNMEALSKRNDEPTKASRPFDKDRDGFVLAEGAAVLVIESLSGAKARGARILAEVAGYGSSDDAYHITSPDPDGKGMAASMVRALEDSRLRPESVEYINAHGTSTRPNDASETLAIKRVFGQHAYKLAVSSTKSMTGHCLGGAGALEAGFCVMSIVEGFLPPTVNLDEPDDGMDLDYIPNKARSFQPRVVISNSFGFGGTNASLVITAYKP